MSTMRRQAVLPPVEGMKLEAHLMQTIVEQGHLCPLPTYARPVYWEQEHALSLYPLPDVLILADRHPEYQSWREAAGVHIVNPSSFHVDGLFTLLYPFRHEVAVHNATKSGIVAGAWSDDDSDGALSDDAETCGVLDTREPSEMPANVVYSTADHERAASSAPMEDSETQEPARPAVAVQIDYEAEVDPGADDGYYDELW